MDDMKVEVGVKESSQRNWRGVHGLYMGKWDLWEMKHWQREQMPKNGGAMEAKKTEIAMVLH